VWNRRRVVYYAILLLLILGELLGERNYIIIIFPEYDNPMLHFCRKFSSGVTAQQERRLACPIREKMQEGEKRLRRVEKDEAACVAKP